MPDASITVVHVLSTVDSRSLSLICHSLTVILPNTIGSHVNVHRDYPACACVTKVLEWRSPPDLPVVSPSTPPHPFTFLVTAETLILPITATALSSYHQVSFFLISSSTPSGPLIRLLILPSLHVPWPNSARFGSLSQLKFRSHSL